MKTRILFLILSLFLNIGGWFLGAWLLHLVPYSAWYDIPVFFCCMTFCGFNLFVFIIFAWHLLDGLERKCTE